MKIAIIGAGISGLTCARLLNEEHDIQVFESNHRIGGHTATVDVVYAGKTWHIDTGFIVYNDWTYPNFIKLLDQLGVESLPTEMSFSVKSMRSGLEYAGTNLNTLFAQRRNLLYPRFWKMLYDIVRFNRQAIRDLDAGRIDNLQTLGDYLRRHDYSDMFINHYLVPMGSAIWSSSVQAMQDFPLLFFVRFFKNHGLLNILRRPRWRVIRGGSRCYLEPLSAPFADRIQTDAKIRAVHRHAGSVGLELQDGTRHYFDQLVFACHSDQALRLLGDEASPAEQAVLGAIPYRNNDVVLHTDTSVLPENRRAWASWNYHQSSDVSAPPSLSYNMNILQHLNGGTTFIVTLNASHLVQREKVLARFEYAHPVFTAAGTRAQNRWQDINGVQRTWFCGAYWRNGFHEDGCTSGIRVARALSDKGRALSEKGRALSEKGRALSGKEKALSGKEKALSEEQFSINEINSQRDTDFGDKDKVLKVS